MHRLLSFLLLTCILATAAPGAAVADPASLCKGFFQAVNNKDYKAAWGLLTEKSKKVFCEKVASPAHLDTAKVRQMFDANTATLVARFWTGFRTEVHADKFLACKFAAGAPTGGLCVVKVTVPDKSKSLGLKMYSEQGTWHLGYAETFL